MRSLASIPALLALWSPLVAQEKTSPGRELDRQLVETLKDVHNRGADLYNVGDTVGISGSGLNRP